ncbi:MAG TPA: P27 family phage terminase small subunit, partial [Pirellulales bacterium]|nr:P27 family phage terminase small subunit [Pirellulales bacterium]
MSSELREMLVSYCAAYGAWMDARRQIATEGQLVDGKRHPLSTDLHKHRDTMNRLLPEFGLTPASRSKLVSMKDDSKDNPFGMLLERMSGTN